MHYSDKPESVRVDFWKPSGEWYSTEAVIWTGQYRDQLIHYSFAQSLRDHLTVEGRDGLRMSGMSATCLKPYHEHSHPISMMVEEAELVKCPACPREVIRGDISKRAGNCIRCALAAGETR